jgi:hypothetical protein
LLAPPFDRAAHGVEMQIELCRNGSDLPVLGEKVTTHFVIGSAEIMFTSLPEKG